MSDIVISMNAYIVLIQFTKNNMYKEVQYNDLNMMYINIISTVILKNKKKPYYILAVRGSKIYGVPLLQYQVCHVTLSSFLYGKVPLRT